LIVFKEGFTPATEQEYIIVAFLAQELGLGYTLTLVEHVDNDELVWGILEPEQLRNGLVTSYIDSWEVY
jgi:hypothetical protein